MLTPACTVALVTPSQEEAQLFMQALAACNYRRVTVFTSGKEAYEVCSRQQFGIFVTRAEMPDLSGIVLIQKLRATGNYGIEPHLLVCNQLDSPMLNICAEYDLDYVMVPPFKKASVLQKFKHMINTENHLSEAELRYRDAKVAFKGKMVEMAETYLLEILPKHPQLEKGWILMGDIEADRNRLDKANEHYKKALAINPKSTLAVYKLAQILMMQQDFAQASGLLGKLALLNPLSIKVLESAGLSSYNREDYGEAKAYMTQLSTMDEDNRIAATVTANVKIKTGDLDGLVAGLRKGMDDKELIQFLNNAGAKLSSDNDIDGALAMYSAATEQIQNSKFLYAIHYNMGIAYKKKRQLDKAKSHFEKAIKLNPSFEKALSALKDIA